MTKQSHAAIKISQITKSRHSTIYYYSTFQDYFPTRMNQHSMEKKVRSSWKRQKQRTIHSGRRSVPKSQKLQQNSETMVVKPEFYNFLLTHFLLSKGWFCKKYLYILQSPHHNRNKCLSNTLCYFWIHTNRPFL